MAEPTLSAWETKGDRTMTLHNAMRGTIALLATFLLACAKGEQSNAAADSTARNLTRAPRGTSAARHDVPAPEPAPVETKKAPAPVTRPPAARPKPATPPAPTIYTAAAGTHLDMAVTDTISSRTNHAGDAFSAKVVDDVKDARGHVVIPAGAVISGTVTAVKPAPNPNEPGTLTLSVSSATIRGTKYDLDAHIDSLETVRHGRGVTTGDAAKVGAGAAAGAILGRVVGGNKRGTIIGGLVGAAGGAGIAATSKDADIVLPAGAHVIVTLNKALAVRASWRLRTPSRPARGRPG